MPDNQTLPGALAAEIARVSAIRTRHVEAATLAGPQGRFGPAIAMMSASLDAAIAAAGSPDVVGQARALEDLRGFSNA